MTSESDQFFSQDGKRLYYKKWKKESDKYILGIIHGLGEHSGRYEALAEHFTGQGFVVFAMDLRGHGKSEGKRGHTPSYDHLMSDIEEFLKTMRAEYTDVPIFLLGQSMGGNLVANYMIRMNTGEISGFILSSAWFRLAFTPPKWKVNLASAIDNLLPSLSQPNDLDPTDFAKDPQVSELYKNDPLVHHKISVRMFNACKAAGEYALGHASKVKRRGFICHGDADPIVDWRGSQEFAEKAGMRFHLLPGALHEPLNDYDNNKLMDEIIDWIKSSRD